MVARRRVAHGPSYDLVVGVDLTDASTRARVLRYFRETRVLVAAMAPVCAPYGPMGHIKKAINS